MVDMAAQVVLVAQEDLAQPEDTAAAVAAAEVVEDIHLLILLIVVHTLTTIHTITFMVMVAVVEVALVTVDMVLAAVAVRHTMLMVTIQDTVAIFMLVMVQITVVEGVPEQVLT
jgi:hypothetical protein